MGKYAQQTTVAAERSRQEIERTLTRYGATQFMYGWAGTHAQLAFVMGGRQIRFVLPLPDVGAAEFVRTPTGRARTKAAATEAHTQAVRQRWRALALVIKAKLEAVETGIVGFDDEFLAHIVLPDGKTVAEHALPAIEVAYSTGTTPQLLPGAGG